MKFNKQGIDLFKFVMAICVIAIHTQPFVNRKGTIFLKIYNNFVNCAVPFFFMSSGYLLAVKMKWPFASQRDIKVLKFYLINIIKLYAM